MSGASVPDWRPYSAALGAILCWASLAAAVGHGLHRLHPEQVLFLGLLTAGLALAARNTIRWGWPVRPWPGWSTAAVGLYGIWGYHTILVLALSLAPPIEANILNYTWPLWIVVLGSLVAEHRRSRWAVPAAVLGFAGAALVIAGAGGHAGGGTFDTATFSGGAWLGLALALGAGFCWGSFTILIRRVTPPGQEHMTWYCLLSAGAAGVVVLARGLPLLVPLQDLWIPVFIGLVPLALAFVLWERAVQGCNLQVLGLLSFLTPPLSVGLQALAQGRGLGWHHLGGLALILLGAAWGSRNS
jgi:drug/metabolite transporter (DMT)-like permease